MDEIEIHIKQRFSAQKGTPFVLYLKDHQLKPHHCKIIAEYILQEDNVKHLNLDNCRLNAESFLLLCNSIIKSKNLLTLSLCRNAFEEDAWIYIGIALQQNKSLISINLSHNQLSCSQFSDLLSSLSINPRFSTVLLSNCIQEKQINQNQGDKKAFSESLREFIHSHVNLKYLDLSSNYLDDEIFTSLVSGLQTNNERELSKLNVANNNISTKSFSGLCSYMIFHSGIKTLNVANNKLDDYDLQNIIRCLKQKLELKCIDVSNNQFSEKAVVKLLTALKSVELAYVQYFSIDGCNVNKIYPEELEQLLARNKEIVKSINYLDNLLNLTKLHAEYIQSDEQSMAQTVYARLHEAQEKIIGLKKLDFSNKTVEDVALGWLTRFLDIIQQYCHIPQLLIIYGEIKRRPLSSWRSRAEELIEDLSRQAIQQQHRQALPAKDDNDFSVEDNAWTTLSAWKKAFTDCLKITVEEPTLVEPQDINDTDQPTEPDHEREYSTTSIRSIEKLSSDLR